MKKLRLISLITTVFLSCCSYNVEPFVGNVSKGFADGKGSQVFFNHITGKGAVDNDGNLYIPDYANLKVRKVSLDGTTSTFFILDINDTKLNPYKQELAPNKIEFDNKNNIYINYDHYGLLKIEKSLDNKYFVEASFTTLCGIDNKNNIYVYGENSKKEERSYLFLKIDEKNDLEEINFHGFEQGGSYSNCFGFDKKTNEILYYDFKKGSDDIPVWIFDKPAPDIYSKYRLNVKTLEKRPFEIDSMHIEFDSDSNIYYFKDSKVYKSLVKDNYKTKIEIASFVGISKLDANLSLDEKRKILYVYGFSNYSMIDSNQIFKVKI